MLKLKYLDLKKNNQLLAHFIVYGETPNKPRSQKEVNYVQV